MLLPGPEAQQLAVYTGWLLNGTRGGVIAGALFVLPGALLMWAISVVYVCYGKLPWLEAVFYGLKSAVLAVVISAVLRIGAKALRHPALWVVAAGAFVAIFGFGVPFPVIVLCALAIGLLGGKRFPWISGHGGVETEGISQVAAKTSLCLTLARVGFWLAVWLLPLAVAWACFGKNHVLVREGVFFSKAALVTFGGAYAVLPYVAQQAAGAEGWLSAAQMMDGLGLAETTPGPLVLVLQFVGFLGGWHAPEGMPPLWTATLGSAMTLWCTFIPGYLFIFAGAPFIERTRGNVRLRTALSVVTAAVVGVVLNLAVWFGWHVVVPRPGDVDAVPLVAGMVFLFLLRKCGWGVVQVVALGALLGLALRLAGIR
jgi:chromate transporter